MSSRLEKAQLTASEMAHVTTSQIFCIGSNFAKITYYTFDISFQRTSCKWMITKRYSEFYTLRIALKNLLKQETKRNIRCLKAYLPLKLVDEAITSTFPRKHFRKDNGAIIEERRVALESFVQSLVKVMYSFPPDFDKKENTLSNLHNLLKTFLSFPEEQLHLNNKRTLAILALEDVVVESSTNMVKNESIEMDCCSICLGGWNEEEYADMRIVKLPCNHAFHEECVMEWLHGSAECPLCRSEPIPNPQ
ncbi:cleavage induced hypothetical protein [Thraustotheca clavata]|uniref:RING-type domain-containing protein n=1 Tax=Thraustotheca clavata TaxID=74557 RepID=A0A1W0A7P1_9STRA|nr:cleavage induced hypothetical protein [Thraustotheca clavata]